jgi:hypothetical protein
MKNGVLKRLDKPAMLIQSLFIKNTLFEEHQEKGDGTIFLASSTRSHSYSSNSTSVPSCTIRKTRFAYVAYNIWDRCNYYVLLNESTEFIHYFSFH